MGVGTLQKLIKECHQCHTVLIQIRLDVLSGLTWVQTVYKDYQQTTLVGKELLKLFLLFWYLGHNFLLVDLQTLLL